MCTSGTGSFATGSAESGICSTITAQCKERKTSGFENGLKTGGFRAPEGIRTPDLCLRRAALYPAEPNIARISGGFDGSTSTKTREMSTEFTVCVTRV